MIEDKTLNYVRFATGHNNLKMEELQAVKMVTEMLWNDLGKQDKKGLIESLEQDMELQKKSGGR